MATPSKKTGKVSTPSALGQSPAPRSVPSPTASRKDHAGKTPINPPTASSQGSKTLVSAPMARNISQTGMVNTPSPSTHGAASLGTPLAGLGLDLGSSTPGLLNMPTPLGGLAMIPTLSELGLTASGGQRRNEDEERRVKMRRVLKSIGRPKGRVCEEGIARISRRVGLETDIDVETAEEKARKAGNRTFTVAGKAMLMDVEMKNHMPVEISVSIGDGTGSSVEYAAEAGKALLQDLRATDGVLLTTQLDLFAANLERLAKLDRLSDKTNCFDALSGLYVSLRRLFDAEKQAVTALQRAGAMLTKRPAEVEVTRTRSGRPRIHPRRQIGTTLEYWIPVSNSSVKSDEAMDTDGAPTTLEDDPGSFSLQIDVKPSLGTLYPALRISDAWLPKTFELPPPETGLGIPWENPTPTLVSVGSIAGSMDIAGLGEQLILPDLHFVAKLHPPVIMPYQTAVNIYTILGADPPPVFAYTPYHAMLLDSSAQAMPNGAVGKISASQTVLCTRNGQETEAVHHYSLDVPKGVWGFKLEEIPFSHPKQLTDFLPTFRQWAHLGALLKCAFADPDIERVDTPTGRTWPSLDDKVRASARSESTGASVPVNITLAGDMHPTLDLNFPLLEGGENKHVAIQVLPNAEIAVIDSEGVMQTNGRETSDDLDGSEATKLAKGLAVCDDLGVWVEWMRSRT